LIADAALRRVFISSHPKRLSMRAAGARSRCTLPRCLLPMRCAASMLFTAPLIRLRQPKPLASKLFGIATLH